MALVPDRRRVDHGELQGDAAERHAPRPAASTIEVDAYGGREFKGKVDSIAAATGARFSLLPPENATGNFVKVVQRVPVKIVLEAGQDPEHILRPGMSVTPTVYYATETRMNRVPPAVRSVPMSDTAQRQINPWLIAVAVMFATFMEVLDTTVVNVSLPHIAGSLSASIDEATWALTSYLVANAIILPMTGWLASMFGRKRLLMLSVVGFTAASFLCGLAPTLGIADRVPRASRARPAARCSRCRRRCCSKPSRRRIAARRWASGDSASSSRRSSDRCSAAG